MFSMTWKREQQQAAVVSGRQEKKLREFRAQKSKVDALKALNKTPAEMNVSELKLMVTWYKNAGNLPLPTTKGNTSSDYTPPSEERTQGSLQFPNFKTCHRRLWLMPWCVTNLKKSDQNMITTRMMHSSVNSSSSVVVFNSSSIR